ncbi:MAG: dicarboxylate/amino acid:cation symporter [Tannerellaceae bacterium]|jgi:Na+/H+-dicarboxylate symporter|nr:dicarboxylate/amino acid:cation symporter [Tannerellaceae bacterium]
MNNKTKRLTIPLYLQILLGMVAGIVIGITALFIHAETAVSHWVTPWGQLFIRMLQLIAIPLIFVTLVKGVSGLKDISKFSKLGTKTLLIYLCFITISASFGIGAGLVAHPGDLVNKDIAAGLQETYHTVIAEKALAAEQVQEQGPLNFLNDIVPGNIIHAAGNNSNILQVIFFAILFAVALLLIPQEKAKPVIDLFDGLNDIILKMVDFIIRLAPIGVAALMAGLVTDFKGDGSIFSALGLYAATVAVAMFAIMFLFYPLMIRLFGGKIRVRDFLRAMYPVQLFAFTTSSSAVTLPVTMKATENELNVSKEVSSFVLPIGVTVNMDGTSCYQAIAILFIAQVLGIDLTLSQILTVLFMTILSSIGTPGIPGGTYVILAMVLTSVGIPAEGLALIIGIDRPLDMLRTAVNVTGDAAVACMIDQNDKKKLINTT